MSRQRETLADASSVQFTRNPEGIGGALYKIGIKGGYLDTTSHASDMNHMCFGEAARMKFASLLASHPPIDQRINAIQPGLMARLRSRLRDTQPASNLHPTSYQPGATRLGDFASQVVAPVTRTAHLSPPSDGGTHNPRPNTLVSGKVGTVSRQSEAYAIRWLNQLPSTFRNLLYTRTGAVQLCYALLLAEVPHHLRHERLNLLAKHSLIGPRQELLDKLLPTLEQLGEGARFPVLELAMPALRKLEAEERKKLAGNVRVLVVADKRLSLFELGLTTFLERHLAKDAARAIAVKYRSYKAVQPAISQLFSLFARAGTGSPEQAQNLYQEAMAGFGKVTPGTTTEKVTMRDLRAALKTLSHLSPLLKPAILDACSHCIMHDGKVAIREYELMRLVADQLDCPMPPL